MLVERRSRLCAPNCSFMDSEASAGEQNASAATAREVKTEDRVAVQGAWVRFYLISHAEHSTCEV